MKVFGFLGGKKKPQPSINIFVNSGNQSFTNETVKALRDHFKKINRNDIHVNSDFNGSEYSVFCVSDFILTKEDYKVAEMKEHATSKFIIIGTSLSQGRLAQLTNLGLVDSTLLLGDRIDFTSIDEAIEQIKIS